MATNLSKSVEDLAGFGEAAGHKKYKELYAKQVAARIDEQSTRLEALESTLKTVNGMAQLAQQQIAVLTRQLAAMKSLPAPNGSDEEFEGTEVKGE